MKVQILTEKENALLHRKELEVLVKDFGATPNRKDITKQLAATLQTGEANLLLDKVDQQFGKDEAVCYVKVYQTEDQKKKYAPAHMRRRMGEEIPKKEKKKKVKKGKKTPEKK
jgi:small subunit ribosomal protein S24e